MDSDVGGRGAGGGGMGGGVDSMRELRFINTLVFIKLSLYIFFS